MDDAGSHIETRRIVIGNWKMCGSRDRLGELEAMAGIAARAEVDVVLCPPFPLIDLAARRLPGLAIGAQDCHHEREGPFTGSVSPVMLRELGASHVIVGHSERRAACGETDGDVRRKAVAAIRAGLVAIVCLGETGAQHDAGETLEIVARQIAGAVPEDAEPATLLVAYEPVWAIGSGLTPAPDEVDVVFAALRAALVERLGDRRGRAIRLLYGGSVTAANAGWILRTPEVGGLLVGSASLSAREFAPIVRAAGVRRPQVPAAAA